MTEFSGNHLEIDFVCFQCAELLYIVATGQRVIILCCPTCQNVSWFLLG